MTPTRRKAMERFFAQQKWVEEHGSIMAGYVARYGSKNDVEFYGNGGEAIYAADKAELDRCYEAWQNG